MVANEKQVVKVSRVSRKRRILELVEDEGMSKKEASAWVDAFEPEVNS